MKKHLQQIGELGNVFCVLCFQNIENKSKHIHCHIINPFSRFLELLLITMIASLTACKKSPNKENGQIESSILSETTMNNITESSILSGNAINNINEESIDIPVSINLVHTDDEDMKQLVDAEYEITRETDSDIYIDTNSEYYKKYMSGHRFYVPELAFCDGSEDVEYLSLSLDIVNNTNKKLDISELDIIVNESKQDRIPIIYICTEEDHSNTILFVNESWFNWGGFTFSYSILKKGEWFDGKYKKSKHIPYFEYYTYVDLLSDMKEMGYDFEELVNSIRDYYIKKDSINNTISDVEPWRDECLCFAIDKDNPSLGYFQEKFKPFELKKPILFEDEYQGVVFKDEYQGVATLYGSLKFDNINYKVDFIANISLSTTGGFGALSYVNDSFDVKLKSNGNSYNLRYPYSTVIEPQGSEYVKLTIAADKSSTHHFYIDIKNNNDLKVRSKNIHFHYYFPKN